MGDWRHGRVSLDPAERMTLRRLVSDGATADDFNSLPPLLQVASMHRCCTFQDDPVVTSTQKPCCEQGTKLVHFLAFLCSCSQSSCATRWYGSGAGPRKQHCALLLQAFLRPWIACGIDGLLTARLGCGAQLVKVRTASGQVVTQPVCHSRVANLGSSRAVQLLPGPSALQVSEWKRRQR